MLRTFWQRFLFVIFVFILSQGGAYAILYGFGIAGQEYSSVIVNAVFLIACLLLIRVLKLSAGDLGLRLVKERLPWHVALCLMITVCYLLFYIFAMRISALRPMTSAIFWSFANYLIVVLAEEIFFRGICYGIIQNRSSSRMAVFGSALLFGLAHARQGLGAMISRFFTGGLWGSVRYSTDMIFLLIVPVHLIYNVVWLLFEGNWENPPLGANYFPLFELLLGIGIMIVYDRIKRSRKLIHSE